MAMKKKASAPKQPSKNDDAVIYRVMIALVFVCLAVLALLQVSRLAVYTDTMVQTYDATIYVAIAGAVGAAVLLAVCFALKSKTGKTVLRLCALAFGIAAVSAAALRIFWTPVLPLLYFAYLAAGVLYLIYMIYQKEFFLVSFLTALAGLFFYLASKAFSPITLYALALVTAVAAALLVVIAHRAGKTGGVVRLGGRPVLIFSGSYNPLFLYLTSAIWALCLVAVLLLGSTFAYYCMFAAIAYELIAACYYTIKLT